MVYIILFQLFQYTYQPNKSAYHLNLSLIMINWKLYQPEQIYLFYLFFGMKFFNFITSIGNFNPFIRITWLNIIRKCIIIKSYFMVSVIRRCTYKCFVFYIFRCTINTTKFEIIFIYPYTTT